MEYTNHKDEIRNKYVGLLDTIVKNEKMSRKKKKSIYNNTIQTSKEKYKKRK